MIALRRSLVPLVVVLVVLATLFYAVFPLGTYLDQRSAIDAAEAELVTLYEENQELQNRMAALSDIDEIERIARMEYNLIFPGEEAYAILPQAPQPVQVPDLWPFNALVSSLSR
ncbi:MAG: septum formation initiator family protein [bacterium]|nr:septum formation initiator family protein [bacterium]MCY4257366.1 septum formation initiator family protein [bacterium]